MNKTIVMGNLTKDPEVRYTQSENSMAVARYTLAVNRRGKQRENNDADYIPCVAFGKLAEFADKYYHKGTKALVTGHLQSGSYVNKEGHKVYTLDLIVEDQEFAGGKKADNNTEAKPSSTDGRSSNSSPSYDENGFMSTGIDINNLPFN